MDGRTTLLLAPNSFKGSLSALEVCSLMSRELADSYPLISLPAGDGGDGTGEIIASYFQHTERITLKTTDALNRPSESFYYRSEGTAIIELARICGLKTLRPCEYNVLDANTRGLGIAINHAVENGAGTIILCVGGSASVDGGLGALSEMGLDLSVGSSKCSNYLVDLKNIHPGHLKEKFKKTEFIVLCDVDNPLCGPDGAARIFAPQKGASPSQVEMLETQLKYYASLLSENTGLPNLFSQKHGGAAGGIAIAFFALLDARLLSGSEYYLNISHFRHRLSGCQAVITGEGRLDSQSLYGKIPGVIAREGKMRHKKVIAVAGCAEDNLPFFDRIFQLQHYAPSLAASIENPSLYFPALCRDLKRYLAASF